MIVSLAPIRIKITCESYNSNIIQSALQVELAVIVEMLIAIINQVGAVKYYFKVEKINLDH